MRTDSRWTHEYQNENDTWTSQTLNTRPKLLRLWVLLYSFYSTSAQLQYFFVCKIRLTTDNTPGPNLTQTIFWTSVHAISIQHELGTDDIIEFSNHYKFTCVLTLNYTLLRCCGVSSLWIRARCSRGTLNLVHPFALLIRNLQLHPGNKKIMSLWENQDGNTFDIENVESIHTAMRNQQRDSWSDGIWKQLISTKTAQISSKIK